MSQNAMATRHQAMLVAALGAIICDALAMPGTSEVAVNPDGSIWHERHGQPMVCLGYQTARAAAAVIRLVATLNHKTVHSGQPSLQAVLPAGQRFQGFMPPRTTAPAYCIRVPQAQVLTREDYVPAVMPGEAWDLLAQAIAQHDNIMLVGGMGSGKTTLLNALSRLIPPDVRIVTMEDTAEATPSVPNHMQLYTRDGESLQAVVKEGFRTAARRALVGEIRDGETALNTWNLWLGVGGGLCTTHGKSAWDGLVRLRSLCVDVGGSEAARLIGEVVDLVVFLERVDGRPQLREVLRVQGWKDNDYVVETVWTRGGVGAGGGGPQ